MKVKKLYGCWDSETGELVGSRLGRRKRYAWCHYTRAQNSFIRLLRSNPERYEIVELVPQYLEETLVCHAQ